MFIGRTQLFKGLEMCMKCVLGRGVAYTGTWELNTSEGVWISDPMKIINACKNDKMYLTGFRSYYNNKTFVLAWCGWICCCLQYWHPI